MIRKFLYAIVFLCVPAAILITAIVRREPTYQGLPASVWVGKIRTDKQEALSALKHLGADAVPALRAMLNGKSRTESCRAAWAMGRLNPAVARQTVPDLIQVLDAPDVVLRQEAMTSLARIGITNEAIVPDLLGQLTNTYTDAFAATLLNSIEKKRSEEKLPPFPAVGYAYGMACLKSPKSFIRVNGAIQLAQVASTNERARLALQSLLRDADLSVRVRAARLMTNPDALPNFKMISE